MYLWLPLSLIETSKTMLHGRDIDVGHEAVRYRWYRFDPLLAAEIRKRRLLSSPLFMANRTTDLAEWRGLCTASGTERLSWWRLVRISLPAPPPPAKNLGFNAGAPRGGRLAGFRWKAVSSASILDWLPKHFACRFRAGLWPLQTKELRARLWGTGDRTGDHPGPGISLGCIASA